MPTATDLVTDLPADFEVFGQAVDTDFVDLLGGTTGQVLSKTSATDLDFTWINNDQGDITGVTAGNGITVTDPTGPVPTVAINTAVTADLTTAQTLTNKTLTSPALTTPTISTLTTNGDLLYGTGSGALARKAIGTTGQVLTVASGIPAWATPTSGGMTLLSTTSTTTGSAYTVSSIDQTYVNLLIVWQGLSCTAGSVITLAFAGGNSSTGGVNQDGTTITTNAAAAKLHADTQAVGNAINCLITNYTATASKNLQIAYGGLSAGWRGGGYTGFHSYDSAISTFTVTLSSGSFSAGSLKLYGVK